MLQECIKTGTMIPTMKQGMISLFTKPENNVTIIGALSHF